MTRKIQLIYLMAVCLLLSIVSFAQRNINGLIKAEKSFASFTLAHTIKEGFLNYMDSTGIVFRKGIAVNALKVFREQKAGPGILTWRPSFAATSSSGDMGVTSGPYEFREKSITDTPVTKGTFSSIWQINQKGEWKNLLDLGIAYNSVPAPVSHVEQVRLKTGEIITFSLENVLIIDHTLNEAIQHRDKEIWQPYLSSESILNMEGHTPYKGPEQINAVLRTFPLGIVLQPLSGGMASSRDFAYVYGTISVGDKTDNYLRVWIFRNGHWQVILQTIKW